jgi:hypothetical protein
MNFAGKLYLSLLCATNYPEQEPAHKVASNWDLLWFLAPIPVGLLLFMMSIENRHKKDG